MFCPGVLEEGGSEGVHYCPELYFSDGSDAFGQFGYYDIDRLNVACVRIVGGLFCGEYGVPCADLCLQKRDEVFKEFVGVVDGFA